MQYPGHAIKAGEADKPVVRAVQQRLLENHCGPVDASGVFGPRTTSAVKLFQGRHADANGQPLKVDGKIGPLTWAVLFGAATVPTETVPASVFLAAVVARAASQVGVLEQPRNSNSGPEVNEYLRRAGVPLTLPSEKKPWCCAFTYWCFDEAAREAGRANPMVRTAGCLDHWNRAGARGVHRIGGPRAAGNPSLVAPGMVFIMDFGRGLGHTGFVERVEGGFIHTIEGNTDPTQSREGGGVYRLVRKMADVKTGYIDYGNRV